jgi:hypothetical protein
VLLSHGEIGGFVFVVQREQPYLGFVRQQIVDQSQRLKAGASMKVSFIYCC